MGLFNNKNPNEITYGYGKKRFTDVIKKQIKASFAGAFSLFLKICYN